MKTSSDMIRKIGDFEVIQRTKDSMFNATKLLQQWNACSGQKKDISHFFENESTWKYIRTIIEREFSNPGIPASAENQVFMKQKGGKERGSTWMCPSLFIDFAMWLNTEFKYDVLKFVQDEMIKCRNEAGDAYNDLGAAVQKIVTRNFMKVAMPKVAEALNWIVFNSHEPGIRNKFGNEKEQRELSALERKVVDLIEEGFITDYVQLVSYLRKMYIKKNCPKVFAA